MQDTAKEDSNLYKTIYMYFIYLYKTNKKLFFFYFLECYDGTKIVRMINYMLIITGNFI